MDVPNSLVSTSWPRAILLMLSVAVTGCDNSRGQEQTVVAGTTEELAALEAQATLSSGFSEPNANGTFSTALTPAFTGSFKDAQGNGYAYEVSRTGADFGATSGILRGTAVGDLPTQGMAAMSGVWNVAEIGKTNGDGREFGEAIHHTGRIMLRADFEFGTLEGSNEDLTVLGRFHSTDVSGNVFWDGRTAQLTGRIGQDRAVGAFHGADDNAAFAGGFYVEP